jgi:hypothetical protein
MVGRYVEPKDDMASGNKKSRFPGVGNAAESSQDPLPSGFPTLVLPRSGCEGRPIVRTLSLMAPLALAIADRIPRR